MCLPGVARVGGGGCAKNVCGGDVLSICLPLTRSQVGLLNGKRPIGFPLGLSLLCDATGWAPNLKNEPIRVEGGDTSLVYWFGHVSSPLSSMTLKCLRWAIQ